MLRSLPPVPRVDRPILLTVTIYLENPMLFRSKFLEGIQTGAITVAFRRWRRPSVRSGGTLLTPVGQLHIDSVTVIELDQISVADALAAGYESREELLMELNSRSAGEVYKIDLGSLLPDPRIALRESPVTSAEEPRNLRQRLQRLDARGAWTFRVLEILDCNQGVRAGDLCVLVGQQLAKFKLNVRKLKKLGLTESLGTGYRLSPRGLALLASMRGDGETVN